jgi:methionyl-tRNA formyltransferase
MALLPTEIKKLAKMHKLKIYQPDNINSQESVDFLNRLNPDILVVVAFGQILSQEILSVPNIFAINLHASLLPKYRGAAPLRWAIISGESQTGLTVIKMVQRLDAGPIILQTKVNIEDSDTALTLEEKLSHLGGDILCQSLDLIQDNRYNLVNQNEKDASSAPKLKKKNGMINWSKSARDIFNLIRGCAGWPGAYTNFKGKILKIHSASLVSERQSVRVPEPQGIKSSGVPGEVIGVSKQGIAVATGGGDLLIKELQVEGKKKTAASEFISGYSISVGENFTQPG